MRNITTDNEILQRFKGWEENGIRLIDENPSAGAKGLNIAFVHPKSTHGVLAELCEK